MRLKRDIKEKADREAALAKGLYSNSVGSEHGYYNASSSYGTRSPSKYSAFPRPGPGYQRGGYTSHRGRGGSFHPYNRPTPAFWNKSAIFNKSEHSADSSDAESRPSKPPNTNVAAESGHQQTEHPILCPALTSTGIFDDTAFPIWPFLFPSNNRVGVCARHGCRYDHDPNKQALCKRWLYKDDCPKGAFCLLSHSSSPENAPTCLHFQDDRCSKDDCRFAHVHLNPAASNCDSFGRLGYCEKGNACTNLHAHECPTFANTGICSYGDKCRLGHVHRASRMRKANRLSSVARDSPLDSPEEDLDTAEDTQEFVMKARSTLSHEPQQFIQQADFVPLNADD